MMAAGSGNQSNTPGHVIGGEGDASRDLLILFADTEISGHGNDRSQWEDVGHVAAVS
jgi:hypothetical protein